MYSLATNLLNQQDHQFLVQNNNLSLVEDDETESILFSTIPLVSYMMELNSIDDRLVVFAASPTRKLLP